MEFDPSHISMLKAQIAESEKIIADLKQKLAGKEEERTRMETQIIQLSENIASKNLTIEDLEQKIEILKESLEDLVQKVHENDETKKMAGFLKSELEKCGNEVVLLTKERDMLNWKLIHEDSQETDAEQERKILRDENLKLASENNDLTNELDKLAKKLDQFAQRDSNLTAELEKSSKFTEQLQADFQNTINSKNKILAEVENLKQQLADLKKSMNSNLLPSPRRLLRGSASNRPSLIPTRSSVSKSHRLIQSNKNSLSKTKTLSTPLTPKNSFDGAPSSTSKSVKSFEESIVRKIVNNIQNNFDSSAILSPFTKPCLLVKPQSSRKLSKAKTDIQDQDKRKMAVDSVRNILENNLLTSPSSEITLESKYPKVNMRSNSSMSERERKNHGL